MGKLFHDAVLDEILLQERVVSSRNRRNPRDVKRKMSKFPVRQRTSAPLPASAPKKAVEIIK